MSKRKKSPTRLQRLTVVQGRLEHYTAMLRQAGCVFEGTASEIIVWRDVNGETRRIVAYFGPGERFNMTIGKRTFSTSFSISLTTEARAA